MRQAILSATETEKRKLYLVVKKSNRNSRSLEKRLSSPVYGSYDPTAAVNPAYLKRLLERVCGLRYKVAFFAVFCHMSSDTVFSIIFDKYAMKKRGNVRPCIWALSQPGEPLDHFDDGGGGDDEVSGAGGYTLSLLELHAYFRDE